VFFWICAAGWQADREGTAGLAGFLPLLRQQMFAFVTTMYYLGQGTNKKVITNLN
jgi:hypothetical protein